MRRKLVVAAFFVCTHTLHSRGSIYILYVFVVFFVISSTSFYNSHIHSHPYVFHAQIKILFLQIHSNQVKFQNFNETFNCLYPQNVQKCENRWIFCFLLFLIQESNCSVKKLLRISLCVYFVHFLYITVYFYLVMLMLFLCFFVSRDTHKHSITNTRTYCSFLDWHEYFAIFLYLFDLKRKKYLFLFLSFHFAHTYNSINSVF